MGLLDIVQFEHRHVAVRLLKLYLNRDVEGLEHGNSVKIRQRCEPTKYGANAIQYYDVSIDSANPGDQHIPCLARGSKPLVKPLTQSRGGQHAVIIECVGTITWLLL